MEPVLVKNHNGHQKVALRSVFFTATQVLFLPHQPSTWRDSAWEASARWCGQRQRSPELPAFTEKEWKEINQVFKGSHCSP